MSKICPRPAAWTQNSASGEAGDVLEKRGKNRKRTQGEIDYQGRVAEFGCVVCRLLGEMQKPGTEIHHIRRGKLRADSHYDVIGLCKSDHTGRNGAHGDKSRIKATGKTEAVLLEFTRQLLGVEK